MVRASKNESFGRRSMEYGVSDRLVMPETRFEIIDGEVIYVNAAGPVHGSFHSKLMALLEASVADGYDVAADMLTRSSELNDFAPDASVFKEGIDPETEDRELEELAFEVISKQRRSRATKKARILTRRGVRRFFAIDVFKSLVLEWSVASDKWVPLPSDGEIKDHVFAVPIAVRALMNVAEVDDAMARALLEKKNPVLVGALEAGVARGLERGIEQGLERGIEQGLERGIEQGLERGIEQGLERGIEQGLERGIEQGLERGKAQALMLVLQSRGFEVTSEERSRIQRLSPSELEQALQRSITGGSVADIIKMGGA